MDEQTTNQFENNRQEEGYDGYGYQGNPFEQMDQDLCKRCRRRRIDRSENPESILCKECREELIKLKVPPMIAGVSIGVAILVIICMVMIGAGYAGRILGRMGDDAASYVSEKSEEKTEADDEDDYSVPDEEDAEDTEDTGLSLTDIDDEASEILVQSVADTGMVVSSMDHMLENLEENPDSMVTAIALVEIAMKYSYYDYAAYTIENYLVGKSVSDAVYDRINGYIEIINKYYDTYDVVDELWSGYSELLTTLETEELDQETYEQEYMQLIQNFHDEIEIYVGDEDYDQAFLYYQLAGVCQDEEERIQHLEDCLSADENYFDAKAQLGVHYRRQGDLEQARAMLEGAYAVNKEVYSVLRGLATVELVEGNLEEGLAYAKEAYDMYPEGTYVVDTYLIALTANGQLEEAETLISEWEEMDYQFDDDFYAFQSGEMTLEQYYIGE